LNTADLLQKIIDLLPGLTLALQRFGSGFQSSFAGIVSSLAAIGANLTRLVAQMIVANVGGTQWAGQTIPGWVQQFVQTTVGQNVANFLTQHHAAVASVLSGGAFAQVLSPILGAVQSAAALLATPVGQLGLAAAGVALALTGLGYVTEKLGRTFLETQRGLAQSSAEMAAVFAVSDMRRTMREMATGGETAESAGALAGHLDDLADTLRPILALLTNLANAVLGILTAVVNVLLKPLGLIADILNKTLGWLAKRFGDSADEGNTILVGEWLENVAKATKEAKVRDDPNFRRPDLRERAQLKP
jgi:hypothetical protein